MLIGVVGDVHWCTYASIIRSRGEEFSTKLENSIKSVNFAEDRLSGCDIVVYAGDFFDRADITAEELSALRKIKWNDKDHFFLVGNHEASGNSLYYTTANALSGDGRYIIWEQCYNLTSEDFQLHFIPYLTEDKRDEISTYLDKDLDENGKYLKQIVISHNDLKVKYGKYNSKSGFDISDIEENCDLFINGHIHNFSKITDKVTNIGNLSGNGFGEDAEKYPHNIAIIDTEDMSIEFIENPYAFNFYKCDFTETGVEGFDNFDFKDNAVVSIVCKDSCATEMRKRIQDSKKIVESRLIIKRDTLNAETHEEELQCKDHLKMFGDYVKETYGVSDIEEEELLGVIGGYNS